MNNHRIAIIFILFWIVSLSTVAAGDGMQPCGASVLGQDAFDSRIGSAFLEGTCIDHSQSVAVIQALVLPSFESEWLVSVYEGRDHKFEVELITLDATLWYANQTDTPIQGSDMGVRTLSAIPRTVPSHCYTRPIPDIIAKELIKLWQYQILNVKYPPASIGGFDGVSYTFAVVYDYLATATACAFSPPQGTGANDLVITSQLLCELAIAKTPDETAGFEKQLWIVSQKHAEQ